MNQNEAPVANLRGLEKLFNLLEDCLKNAPGDQIEIYAETAQTAVTRYAANRIHQNVWQDNIRVKVRVLVQGAVASLICNTLDPVTIKETIGQAAKMARLSPDRTHIGFASATEESASNREPGTEELKIPELNYAEGRSFFEASAGQSPAQRAEAVLRIVEKTREAGFQAFGTYKTGTLELAVVNSNGLRSYGAGTLGYLRTLVESSSGSGYADQLSRDVAQLDPEAIAGEAIQKCRLNTSQIEIPVGDYAAVLEPDAVADMVLFLVQHGSNAREYQEQNSYMSGKMGQIITGENINLWELPDHPSAMPFPIDYEGLKTRPVPLISGGRAAGVTYDRTFAAKVPGRVSTGHAARGNEYFTDPRPEHLVMNHGTAGVTDLVKKLKRGILITRLHYTHCPDQKRVVATGTTRDGTFLVENGEIVAALKNLRFTQSVLELLSGVEEFGAPKTCMDWWSANGMSNFYYYLPSLLVNKCTFTGVTTF
jgi:predicted Zn-dependent protease